jgi:hypothetical protein
MFIDKILPVWTCQYIVGDYVYKHCRLFPESNGKQKFVGDNVANTIVGHKFQKHF